VFFEEIEADESVEQHSCGTRIAAKFAGQVRRRGTIGDGGEKVEFQRRKNRASGHEGADRVVDGVGKKAGALAGFERVAVLPAMLKGHGLDGGGIVPNEARDGLAVAKMRGDDLANVGRANVAIVNGAGIDDQDGAFVAKAKAATGRDLDFRIEVLREKFGFECV
jgi:hypothetical protein